MIFRIPVSAARGDRLAFDEVKLRYGSQNNTFRMDFI